MSKYEILDSMILAALGDEPKRFGMIQHGDVEQECKRIADEENAGRPKWNAMMHGRILDRRLQALRKACKIQSSTKGWTRTTDTGGEA